MAASQGRLQVGAGIPVYSRGNPYTFSLHGHKMEAEFGVMSKKNNRHPDASGNAIYRNLN
jgi:hypothetical protein